MPLRSAYRDADGASLAGRRRTRADRDRACAARARCARAEHQHATRTLMTGVSRPDSDRTARARDALTAAHTHSTTSMHGALTGAHRQQAASTAVAAAYRDTHRSGLAGRRRTRADRDRASAARARCARAEHQHPTRALMT